MFTNAGSRAGAIFDVEMTASKTFIGRVEILKEIETCLLYHPLGNNNLRIVVLYGLGGIGKTQIALKFADIFRQRYADGLCMLRSCAHLNTATNMCFGSTPNLKAASIGAWYVLLSCLLRIAN